jgi:hypothetical protein
MKLEEEARDYVARKRDRRVVRQLARIRRDISVTTETVLAPHERKQFRAKRNDVHLARQQLRRNL